MLKAPVSGGPSSEVYYTIHAYVGLSGADSNVQQPLGERRSAILRETAKSIFTIAGGLVAAAAVVFLLAPADVSDDPGM